MNRSANKDGRMTPQRVEELRAFVRGIDVTPEGIVNKPAAGPNDIVKRSDVDKDVASGLGKKLMEELKKQNVDADKVSKLIYDGADLDFVDEHGNTAMIWAVRNDKAGFVEALIRAGANMNIKDAQGNTALMHATIYGNGNIFSLLLNNGADMDLQNKTGMTALMLAAKYSDDKILQKLLSAGANVRLRDNLNRTVFEQRRMSESVRRILEGIENRRV